jgi:membrane protease YdiL (CAAX protease family)
MTLIKRYPLWSFFILTYALNAGFMLLYNNIAAMPYQLYIVLYAFTPTMGALAVSAVIGGRQEIGRLLSGFTRWKVGWQWYLAAFMLAGIPLIIAIVYILLGNPPRGLEPGTTFWMLLGALGLSLLTGPLGEEAGWRGFALPRLQQKYSALTSSLIVGIFWAGWHFPNYLNLKADPASGAGGAQVMPILIFLPVTLGLSILFAWLYNNSGGSLILTVFAHYCFNFAGGYIAGYFGLMPSGLLFMFAGAGLAVITIAVVVIFGPKHLSRKPVSELPIYEPATGYEAVALA